VQGAGRKKFIGFVESIEFVGLKGNFHRQAIGCSDANIALKCLKFKKTMGHEVC
jgi:hypothetical protein